MKKINLPDGTPIYCLKATEAVVLDDTDVAEPKKSGGFFSWFFSPSD